MKMSNVTVNTWKNLLLWLGTFKEIWKITKRKKSVKNIL